MTYRGRFVDMLRNEDISALNTVDRYSVVQERMQVSLIFGFKNLFCSVHFSLFLRIFVKLYKSDPY